MILESATRVSNLIAAINTITGANDTDITTAIWNLVSLYREASDKAVEINFSSSGPSATVQYVKPDGTGISSDPVYTIKRLTVTKDSLVCITFGDYGSGTITTDVGDVSETMTRDGRTYVVSAHRSGYISW